MDHTAVVPKEAVPFLAVVGQVVWQSLFDKKGVQVFSETVQIDELLNRFVLGLTNARSIR